MARDFFEPWTARQSTAWESGFRSPPAEGADPDAVERWHADRERARKDAGWLVWGSRMTRPEVAATLVSGEAVVMDGAQVVAAVRHVVTDHDHPPGPREVAGRIAECVSACRGIADPADVLDRTRVLLTDLATGKADASDPRVLALLSRIVLPGAHGGESKYVAESTTDHPGCDLQHE